MQLEHRFTVPASVDTTWALFNDLESIAPCFPGASLTSAEGDDFAGTVKVKLGPVALQYAGTGSFLERDETSRTARFRAQGKDKRGNGTAKAEVTAVLSPDGSGTAVAVTTDLAVTGKPAQFGRGLMQDVSDRLLARFVDCLSDRLSGPESAGDRDAPDPGAADSPGAAPTATDGTPQPVLEPDAGAVDGAQSPVDTAAAPRAGAGSEALDLGATVLPVLARRFGPPLLGALLVLLVLRRLLRR